MHVSCRMDGKSIRARVRVLTNYSLFYFQRNYFTYRLKIKDTDETDSYY